MPDVHINGIRLCYDERGDGAPLLCIHGAGSSGQLWADSVEKLARLGRAIAYDRRGYGRSERPEPCDRMDVAEHANDAAALLDALDAMPAVVIARSYGGEVATDLALRYPDRIGPWSCSRRRQPSSCRRRETGCLPSATACARSPPSPASTRSAKR